MKTIEEMLDPELVATFKARPVVGDLTVDIPTKREARAALWQINRLPPSSLVTIQDCFISGPTSPAKLLVRLYKPIASLANQKSPCILWIHGGGFLYGHPDQDDAWCENIVGATGCIVASVDYRLAPEYPFPAGVEDVYVALEWLVNTSTKLGIEADRIAIAGASAGGGIAAAVALMARDRGGPHLAFQMPLYACLDDRHMTPSSTLINDERIWNRANSRKGWQLYLANQVENEISYYATPARAADLTGLPPAYMMVGQLDIVRDENIEYATRLMQAGIPTELHVYAGAFHSFEQIVPAADISKRAIQECFVALKKYVY